MPAWRRYEPELTRPLEVVWDQVLDRCRTALVHCLACGAHPRWFFRRDRPDGDGGRGWLWCPACRRWDSSPCRVPADWEERPGVAPGLLRECPDALDLCWPALTGGRPVPPPRPTLLTFDVFGTVLDWRQGTEAACRAAGRPLGPGGFDAVVDAQGRLEAKDPGRRYAAIVAESLVEVAGLGPEAAARAGEAAGSWPLFPDSAAALAALGRVAPCAPMTNSDRAHGAQVRAQLAAPPAHWFAAEDVGRYKPDPRFWEEVARRLGRTPGPDWWHVSAYGDYDLAVARRLGLTGVFVARPHARPGPADLEVPDLGALAEALPRLFGPEGS